MDGISENRKTEETPVLVTRASMPPVEEYEALVRRIFESRWLTNMGEFHEELKAGLKEKLGVRGLELFVNGHTALEMVIQAFGLRGEVITTPFTFASTVHAIVRNGLRPVFCDIREGDGTLDPEKLEALITKDTAAILPVHVYGNICAYEAIDRVAKEHGLKVIYDAAHAFGETICRKTPEGRVEKLGVGNLGDASMFSFHATKVFHTIEGGAVTWGNPENDFLEGLLYRLKNFGITGKESVELVGGNGKMNEFCAAMGICNLKYVDGWIAARGRLTERYRGNLAGAKGIRFLSPRQDASSNHAYLPVLLEGGKARRDEVFDSLCAEGIFPRKYFYPCANAYACYREFCDERETPVAKRFSESVLTLPLYPDLPEETVDRICSLLQK